MCKFLRHEISKVSGQNRKIPVKGTHQRCLIERLIKLYDKINRVQLP